MIILPHPMPTDFAFTIFAETIWFVPEIEEYETSRPFLASTSQRGLTYANPVLFDNSDVL